MNLQEILDQEINTEQQIIQELNNRSDLDDQSKQQIRDRVYDTYRNLIYLNELENH